ncbi:MAG: hypothetical protein K9L98_01875 [Candidatus Pacebacteria bacterium]|nr:hypothetical protein [Candidatus Paceibacterota bacterium]MCF7862736.1 hypothetical protein [Candidatus Paceibacterota bacterium]
MNTQVKIFLGVIAVLVLGTVVTVFVRGGAENVASSKPSGYYDQFAQCLTDQGAVFYGTFWCPHCQNQKRMFGSSVKFVNYVECSTPDAQKTTPICIEKEIKGYPTWEFADGSRLSGEIPLATLAEKTSCELPL